MSVKTKDELMNALKERIGDDTSDEALALIEDFDDTINDYESKTSDSTDWKTKYEQNDAEWRQKYRDRFFTKSVSEDEPDEDEEIKEPMKFSDLFKGE